MANYVNKKGNWYKYDCPKGLSAMIINFTKEIMRKGDMPAKKLRRFNKVYISCKRTETSVFYKILVYGNKNFVCIDLGNSSYSYKWYEFDKDNWMDRFSYIGDPDDDCSSCGWPYIGETIKEEAKKHPPLICHNGFGQIKQNSQCAKINDECYKYIDSIKEHIPIRIVPGPILIADNKATTYLLFKAIRNKERQKEIKMSKYNEMYIFKRITRLPLEMIRYIIKFL